MKKLSIIAVVIAAVVFASCGGNKSAQVVEENDSIKSFEQTQIEASIKMQFDSLAAELGKLKNLPFAQDEQGKIVVSKEEKQVKPDYLLDPAIAENAATLAEKYRTLVALQIDKQIATIYELPTDEFDKAVTKLVADINDPSFKVFDNPGSLYETSQALYDAMDGNGRHQLLQAIQDFRYGKKAIRRDRGKPPESRENGKRFQHDGYNFRAHRKRDTF